MKQFLVLVFVFVGSITYSQSFKVSSLIHEQNQNGSIAGILLDSEAANTPLAFATVEVKGTNLTTTTNIDGSFSFNLKPGNYTLIYSFIGYKTVEIVNVKVNSNTTSHCNQFLYALAPEMPVLVSQLK